jgi:hypothetical protein
VAGIFTGAGNVLMAHCHLENGSCTHTKKVDKGRATHCYLIPVSTNHITHEHPQADCATYVVQMWCSYSKCGSGQAKVMDKDGSSHLSPSRS